MKKNSGRHTGKSGSLKITAQQNINENAVIIAMKNNDLILTHEYLYSNYACMMYGAILRLTDDETLAEEILIESFVRLKRKTALSIAEKPLLLYLLHHTCLTAINILKAYDILPKRNTMHDELIPILDSLLYKQQSPAAIPGLTKQDAALRFLSQVN